MVHLTKQRAMPNEVERIAQRNEEVGVSVENFVAAHSEVYSAKHASETVYLGRDEAKKWWLLRGDRAHPIEVEGDIADEAQAAAHQLIDGEDACVLQIDWKLIPKVETTNV